MTPERQAELRTRYSPLGSPFPWERAAGDDVHELLDEIDRQGTTLARVRRLCEDYSMEPEQTPGFTTESALFSTMYAYQNVLKALDGK